MLSCDSCKLSQYTSRYLSEKKWIINNPLISRASKPTGFSFVTLTCIRVSRYFSLTIRTNWSPSITKHDSSMLLIWILLYPLCELHLSNLAYCSQQKQLIFATIIHEYSTHMVQPGRVSYDIHVHVTLSHSINLDCWLPYRHNLFTLNLEQDYGHMMP